MILMVSLISVSVSAHFDGYYTIASDANGNDVYIGPIVHTFDAKYGAHGHVYPPNDAGMVSQTSTHKVNFGSVEEPNARNASKAAGYEDDVVEHFPKNRESRFYDANLDPVNCDGTPNIADTQAECMKKQIAANYAFSQGFTDEWPEDFDCGPAAGWNFYLTLEDPADIYAEQNRPAPTVSYEPTPIPIQTPNYVPQTLTEIDRYVTTTTINSPPGLVFYPVSN